MRKISMLFTMLVVFSVLVSCNQGSKPDGAGVKAGAESVSSNSNIPARTISQFDLDGKREVGASTEPGLCNFEKFYPCDVTLQSEIWSTLTVQERMLAKGYEFVDENGASYDPKRLVDPVRNLSSMIACYYNLHSKMPESTDEIWNCIENMMADREPLDRPISEIKKEFYDSLISPVTGRLIEWDKPSFSRGNAFITVMNDNSDALGEVEIRYANLSDQFPEKPAGNPRPANATGKKVHVMARIYGETGIIDSFVTVYTY
jgi:hypothetical protein